MIIGSTKEDLSLEKRVALTPETAKNIIGLGLKIVIEKNYDDHIGIKDKEYEYAGVEIKNYSKEYNLVVTNLINQGDFLKSLGIKERFIALSKNMEKEKIDTHVASLKRLIDYNQMGKLFKVLGIRNKKSSPLIGLEIK